MKGTRPRLNSYVVAVLAVGSALLLTQLLQTLLRLTFFPLFFAAVAVSAWYGGIETGLLATALSALAISYFFLQPGFSLLVFGLNDILRLGVFVLEAMLLSWLNSELCTAKQQQQISMQKLQASEARFRRLADANIIGVIVADINGAIAEANDAFLTMVGYTQEDLAAGRVRWCEMTPPEYAEVSDRSLTQLKTKGACTPFEKEYIRKDNSRVPILLGYAALEDNREEVIGFVLDLSERKEAEVALRKSEERYRAFVEQSSEGIWCFELAEPISPNSPEDEQIQHFYRYAYLAECNNVMAQMYGFSCAEELIGAKLEDFNLPSDPHNIEYLRSFIRSGYRLIDGESHEVDKDGNSKYFLNNLVGIVENGVLVRAWGTQRDITERKQTEDALRHSEKQFRRLVESNIFGVAFGNSSGGIHYANDYFLNMVGYTREDMHCGEVRWDVMTPPEYQHLTAQAAEELKTHGVATPFEKEYIRKDGSRVPILVGIVMLEAGDRQQEMIAFSLDLSDRKRAEAALQQREDQLRLITNALPVMISYVDTEQRYRFNNKRYEEVFELSASELYGKHMQEVLGESIYESIREYVEAVLSGLQVNFEIEVPHKDGTTHYASTTYVPQLNREREVEGFVALISDITFTKQTKAALQESKEKFRKLTEKVRVIPWEADATTGNFTYIGPQSEEILGYAVSDWYADNFWGEHIHPDDRQWAIEYCVDCSRSQDNYEFEYRMLTADGKIVWLYDIVNVVRGENKAPQTLRGFMIDISDRKRAEQEREQLLQREQAARAQAEAANRMKDEFLATLSHELRTPLNPIMGWTQLLRAGKLNQEATANALETIERNTKSLAALVKDVLDVSRIVTGKLCLDLSPVQLAPAILSAMETVKSAARAKDIKIDFFLDSSEIQVLGDTNRLQQIIWNLLANAVKFTPPGGSVRVELSSISELNSEVAAQIQVTDTGEGISADFLPYVFDRFRQADSSRTRTYGGLGLGLAIVRHLVELHGGTVRATSPGIGQGATFTVKLPLFSSPSPPQLNSPTLSVSLNGLRILVVDDEPDARELLNVALQQYGAEVKTVASAQEALTALQELQPNVLVSDIGMPEEDGYTLIRKIRALDINQGGQIPAVALTAYAADEDRAKALLAGFQLHVSKPVNPIELATLVANLSGRV
ncbi:MAG: PAS domain S-box protein [Heteroscytonema crispum UTEX LB 1556]